MSTLSRAIELEQVSIRAHWLPEPQLVFAGGALHVDPKVGIALHGPRSLGTPRHRAEYGIAFVGTADAVDHARKMLDEFAEGVDGDADHHPFPGFAADRGYRSKLSFDDALVETITAHEHRELLQIKRSRERFESVLALLDHKMRMVVDREHPKDLVVIALPEDIYPACRVTNYRDGGVEIHRDLRRAFKAKAMRYGVPTQFVRDSTTGFGESRKDVDHRSVVAWNFSTGLYFKCDGLPWSAARLPAGTCFIGIDFFRPMGEVSTLRASVAQAFDQDGDSLVLRVHDFVWDEQKQGRSPHLAGDAADALIRMVLDRYRKERRQEPRRVVVHKSSRFEPEEREGFVEALKQVSEYDLVALGTTSEARLLRLGIYPPLRGTDFEVGRNSYLYTTGYLPEQGRYPHGHVPSPLRVADHVGDTTTAGLLQEILLLTKMNWHHAGYDGTLPVTLGFADAVGPILREVPSDQEPESRYRYYI
jgi:hypothetical protein